MKCEKIANKLTHSHGRMNMETFFYYKSHIFSFVLFFHSEDDRTSQRVSMPVSRRRVS